MSWIQYLVRIPPMESRDWSEVITAQFSCFFCTFLKAFLSMYDIPTYVPNKVVSTGQERCCSSLSGKTLKKVVTFCLRKLIIKGYFNDKKKKLIRCPVKALFSLSFFLSFFLKAALILLLLFKTHFREVNLINLKGFSICNVLFET